MASGGTLWGALGASEKVVNAASDTFDSKQSDSAPSSDSSTLDYEKVHPILSQDVDETITASLPEVTQLARRLTGLSQQQSRGEYVN
jgi:hypothetical protein